MENKRLVKLAVLRALLIVMLTVAEGICAVFKGQLKAYRYPIKWLTHYLKGSGKALEVPAELVQQARTALFEAIFKDDYRSNYYKKNLLVGKYCVSHSTLYEGRGFYGRPSLFYVMGGFTFRLYKKDGRYLVSGNDHYDWHPTEYGDYFTSPLGDSKLMVTLVKILGLIFGNDLFVTKGWPMGQAGISNKLWDELHKVGAKAFNSYFKNIDLNITPLEEYYLIFDEVVREEEEIGAYEGFYWDKDDFDDLYYEGYFWKCIDWYKLEFEDFDKIQKQWQKTNNNIPIEVYMFFNHREYLEEV